VLQLAGPLALPQSGRLTILKLTCCVCGAHLSFLERERAQSHQFGGTNQTEAEPGAPPEPSLPNVHQMYGDITSKILPWHNNFAACMPESPVRVSNKPLGRGTLFPALFQFIWARQLGEHGSFFSLHC